MSNDNVSLPQDPLNLRTRDTQLTSWESAVSIREDFGGVLVEAKRWLTICFFASGGFEEHGNACDSCKFRRIINTSAM